jgi:hypothetical protein
MDRAALEGPHGVLEHGSFVELYAGLHQQFPIFLFERHPALYNSQGPASCPC